MYTYGDQAVGRVRLFVGNRVSGRVGSKKVTREQLWNISRMVRDRKLVWTEWSW